MKDAHNPDRINARRLPKGWRFLSKTEVTARPNVMLRIWEPNPRGHWGDPISLHRGAPHAFTCCVKR